METLDYFGSAYCFISFILGALFVLIMNCITAIGKTKEQSNKVHFYVARDVDGLLWLYMCKPVRPEQIFKKMPCGEIIVGEYFFSSYGLDVNDYARLKSEDDPVEVFINMEDGGLSYETLNHNR